MTTPQTTDLSSSLASLAMLSLRLKSGMDYLDYLRSFVLEVLRSRTDQFVDARVVQEAVQTDFGLKIPVATFAIYMKRLAREGILKSTSQGQMFQVISPPETSLIVDRTNALTRIAEVTAALAGFANKRYSLTWDERMASELLNDFVRRYSIDFLRFAESRSPLPESATSEKTGTYVVAAFIVGMANEQPHVFESITVLVQSHILANALMCPDLERAPRGFRGLHFLLDTRFAIKLLDLESKIDADSAQSLVGAIKKLRGSLCIFPETKAELRAVLQATIRGMQQSAGRGPVYRELMKRRRGVADVILIERELDERLASLSVSEFPSPAYSEDLYAFQIDERELQDEIENEIDYISQHAADHDIRVVRHIFALRAGNRATSIEEAGYVFLTTNSALSRAVFNFQRKNSDGWISSAVVTDYHLSHLAWLKSPMEVPDLPRAEILATCYAAMKPPESVWNRYIDEVERLRTENKMSERDHEVLRFSANAPDELMDVTRGDVQGINASNVHAILEKLEKKFAADKELLLAQVVQEHEATKKELENARSIAAKRTLALEKATERERALTHENAKRTAEVAELKLKEEEGREREQARKNRFSHIAQRIATYAYILAWIVFGIFGVLSFLTEWSLWSAVPGVIVGVLNIAAGFSGKTIRRFVHRVVANRLSRLVQ